MGLLKKGDMLPWDILDKTKGTIKSRGVQQFINAYKANKDNTTTGIVFGEEIELMTVMKTDDGYKLFCGSESIIDKVNGSSVEYGRFMVEISSEPPLTKDNMDKLEQQILKRCNNIDEVSADGVDILMLPCFPKMSFSRFYDVVEMRDDITLSLNFPDNAMCQHKRFIHFTRNIRNRRGKKIKGHVKVMPDTNTDLSDANKCILIDAMGQGMGCCGLQVTIQGNTIDDARYLYDMLGVLGPLLLRCTRGSPCAGGKLLETETRWDIIEMSVDCRTDAEKGYGIDTSPSSTYTYSSHIPKSRFSPIDLFISDTFRNRAEYNDINVPIHSTLYKKLLKEGVDSKLSKHVASLFIRDPLISYKETDSSKYEDFENIQSSNWRSMRFKLPSKTDHCNFDGWKVEVRTMDIQATPFENTAYVYFTLLLSQAILKYRLNLYIPISKVDVNIKKANKFVRDPSEFCNKLSVDSQTFWYRTNLLDDDLPVIEEGTIQDIFCGKGDYEGLICYVRKFINEELRESASSLKPYIDFVEDKINYKYISLSEYIRRFVVLHGTYRQDSILSDEALDDLIRELVKIRKKNSVDYLLN